jgi:tetratricopeptide repeat protein 12
MGNKSFREGDIETAVSLYSRAIDMVRDSPILYNNRALSYIKLSLYKRGLMSSFLCKFTNHNK